MIGALVGVRVLTGVLDPPRYGQVALAVTLGNVVTQLSLGPLQQGALRFFGPAREIHELRACLAATWALARRASVVVVGLAALAASILLAARQPLWMGLTVGALALALVSGLERILDAVQNAARQRAVTAWHQGLSQWLRFLLAYALVRWLGASASLAILGYVLATGVVLVSQLAFFRRLWWPVVAAESPSREKADLWRSRIVAYARPFAAWGLFTWLLQSSDRWALQTLSATQDVGYYAVLFQLGYAPVMLLTSVLVQIVQPIFSNRSGDGTDPSRVRRTLRLNQQLVYGLIALTAGATGSAFLLHRVVFSALVAPAYQPVSWLMPWMLLSGGLYASGEVAALTLMIGLETRRLRAIKIGASVVGILLNVAGAFWLGLPGVVFASVAFSAVSLVWTLLTSVISPPTLGVAATPLAARTLVET